ncbi:MAG: DUF6261 family protein [Paludibacteraceae bacterium]
MKLESINIAKLGNEDTHGICLATVNLFKPQRSLLDATANAALTQLEEKTSELGPQLNRKRANVLTKGIYVLNKTTDSVWREIKATVKRTAKSLVNAEKAQAATQLEDFLKPYWDSEELSTHTQTANFREMFAKYAANTNLQAKAEAAGVGEALTLLETKNAEMVSLWQQRNDIEGNLTSVPSASNVRREIATTYSRFSLAVENQNTFTPTPNLQLY